MFFHIMPGSIFVFEPIMRQQEKGCVCVYYIYIYYMYMLTSGLYMGVIHREGSCPLTLLISNLEFV